MVESLLLLQALPHAVSPISGGFPAVLDNIWLGEEEAQAMATALQPKLSKTRAAIDGILSDVATLEVRKHNHSFVIGMTSVSCSVVI